MRSGDKSAPNRSSVASRAEGVDQGQGRQTSNPGRRSPPSRRTPSDGSVDQQKPPDARQRLVDDAIKSWKEQLIDLGGRNQLLYYRHLRVGTLDLAGCPAHQVENLLKGRPVRLSELFPDIDGRTEALKRAKAVSARARANDEERGIRTLYMAFGMATWRSEKQSVIPNAPVILQPIDLTPSGFRAEDFELVLRDEQQLNPTLLHSLAATHQLDLDSDELLGAAGESRAEREASSARFAAACAAVTDFSVASALVIGNFSYAKLPMVRDLEQHASEIAEDVLLAAIAGAPDARVELRERHVALDLANLAPVPAPTDEFLALDADSSQSWVISAVVAGADLVMEGPPGTGKSQTIANLIATLAARGKSVLFVAEKRAAIDAVVDRLNKQGLGDLILDLHSRASDRRRVAADIQKSLDASGTILAPQTTTLHRRLERRQKELDEYQGQLHEAVEPWGISAFDAQSRLLGMPPTISLDMRFRGDRLKVLTLEAIADSRESVRRFVELGGLELLRVPSGNAWAATFHAGSGASIAEVEAVLDCLREAHHERLPNAMTEVSTACRALGLRQPETLDEIADLLQLLRAIVDMNDYCSLELFGEDLAALALRLAPARKALAGRLWAAAFDSSFRAARRIVRSHYAGDKLVDAGVMDLVERAQSLVAGWSAWTPRDSTPALWPALDNLAIVVQEARDSLTALEGAAGVNLPGALPDLEMWLDRLEMARGSLLRLPELHRLHRLLLDAGLDEFIDRITQLDIGEDVAAQTLDYVWLTSVLDRISIEQPRLAQFDRNVQDTSVTEFGRADEEHIASGPARVKRAWAAASVAARDSHPTETDIVRRQASLQRRHLPIREFYAAAPSVLTAVKPCWVMSPLLVAQVLPARKCFDVVVFDEASQIPPADAISALLRGRQAVVAGDPHQLPPTTFFASGRGTGIDDDNDDDWEDEDADGPADDEMDKQVASGRRVALVGDQESVLDVMKALLPPPHGTRTLQWHYRSRCERLITFSNAQVFLYNWGLMTFPSGRSEICVEHVLAPGTAGAEEASASASAEVVAVVDLIIEHARKRPEESLGVIAFGIRHASRIEEALRLELAVYPELEEFFSDEHGEPFFVKNLERVQGDERDAIILTVGYSKTKDGRMRYNFGPINLDVGQRRLNVAITRAAIDAEPPGRLDRAIDATPAWQPILRALERLERGGRLVVNAIRKEPADREQLLGLDFARHLWLEKEIKSVANVTRRDGEELVQLAAESNIVPTVERYALERANEALADLKAGKIHGSKVLVMGPT